MPITYEKIEALFEEKFQEALNPLMKQIEDVMKNIQYYGSHRSFETLKNNTSSPRPESSTAPPKIVHV